MRLPKRLLPSLAFLVVFLFLASGVSYAQRLTGSVKGTVTDEENNPLPGVTVRISSPALMGGEQSQITTEKGTYRFVNLPPGVYKIVFSLDGFKTVERLNIKISVKATVTEDIVMTPTTLEESVTVTGEAPVVDVTSSGMSTNYDKELLEKIPSGRYSFLDVIKQTPGIISQTGYSGDELMSAFGSNAESNAFQIDGLDITNPRQGDSYLFPNQDIFTEVEVSGIGAPAEYGSFTGAVVNVVTKSGGNTLSGSLGYYGQFQDLTGDNNPNPDEFFSYYRHQFLDIGFTLGGPILKDRLWFFSSANITRNDATSWKQDPEYHSPTNEDNYFLKISSQITNKHKLVGVIAYRDWAYTDPIDPFTMPEATRLWTTRIPNWNVMYTWLASPAAYVELKIAGYDSSDDGLPQDKYGGSIDNPIHYDYLTGVTSSGARWPFYAYYKRFQAHGSVSYFAEEFLDGDHEFKVGVQYNRGGQGSVCAYSGGKLYYDYGGYPYLLYEQKPFYYGGQVDNIGLFFDDTWTIKNRLTINVGLRYDSYKGSVPPFDVWDGWHRVPGEKTAEVKDVISWNNLSPRIGFAFQLTGDRKTILKAHYGRYYDALFVGTYEWPGPNNTDWAASSWNGAEWELYDFVPGSLGWSLISGLKSPYSDQISFGIEREIFAAVSAGLMAVYKVQKDLIAIENVGGKYELVPVVSSDNGQTYMAYNQLNVGESAYALTNPEGFEQTYKGVILNLNKRYSNNWLLNASLTWSRSEGLSAISPSTGSRQLAIIAETSYNTGKDPNDWTNAKGLMQSDRTWVFKLQFAYSFPWGILASANYQYMSGRPYASVVRVDVNQGTRRILAEPRDNEHRFDPLSVLDIRIQKAFDVFKNLRFSAMLDVFNVFNINTVTGFSSYNMWATNYLEHDSIPPPRRIQIGLRLEF